jgi:putative PIN family toxin of toxin-antitoxin system
MIRVVLDTNLLVSAILSPAGPPAQILKLGIENAITLIFSPAIIAETRRVLLYPKLVKLFQKRQVSVEKIEEFLKKLIRISVMVPGALEVTIVTEDPSDNKIIACALDGRADFLISGDTHLLKLQRYQGVEIISPMDFLATLAPRSKA